MNKTMAAHISLFLSMVIYAAGFTIIKEVTPFYIAPAGFVALRVLGATPLLWLTGIFIKEKVERKDLGKLGLLSLCGVVINQSFFIRGMSLTSPISGAIIMITSPLLVLVLGNIILKEKITWQRFSGIVVGLCGAALLILTNTVSNEKTDSPLGDLFIFINALSWGTFLVLVKPLMKKYHTVTILKWVFLFSIIILVPLGLPDMMNIKWNTFGSRVVFDILFVVIGVTFIAYLMNVFALKALSPSVVSAYIYTQPVMAAAIALLWGKDELTWQKIVSAFLIFAGVMLASQNKKAEAVS
ncbi:MAG: DMT family transporter [Bacteroidota bacterium]|nr:DMT family transporter [Bacteroidota bacterium]